MATLQKLLKHPEFSTFLLILCITLFGWPFISIPGSGAPDAMFAYLFIVWGAVIVLLFFMAKAHGGDPYRDQDEKENGD